MRYRTIDVRLWGDERFRSLSPILPSGQALFMYLLTNPSMTPIPGLYRAGVAAMAEELGWRNEEFMRAFNEVLSLGLVKADLQARVIYIPNAIKYNKPQSPNVVRHWKICWDEIPECELKNLAKEQFKTSLAAIGEGFYKAFTEVIGKEIPKTMPNQEQEPDQEQEQDITSLQEVVVSPADSPSKHPACPHTEIIALYHEILPNNPKVLTWLKTRRGYLMQRWRDDIKHQSLDYWRQFFEHVSKSDFLTGKTVGRNGQPPFVASLEWLIRPNNFAKIIEGIYHRGCE